MMREVDITTITDTHRRYLDIETGQIRTGESLADEFWLGRSRERMPWHRRAQSEILAGTFTDKK